MKRIRPTKRVYLDYAATTPVDPRVRGAMEPYFSECFGNPSSIHSFGQEALAAVEEARRNVAVMLGADPREIVFTGSGTEADNAAILGACRALYGRGSHVVTTQIEHHAVLHTCRFLESQGFTVTAVPPGRDGIVDPEDIQKALTPETVLVSVMHANNEIGTVQPLGEIGDLVKERGILFHSDAVQTFGHLPVNVREMHVDFLALSGHKLYGPKGVGALYIKKGSPFTPLIHGGGQEMNRRSSTHNVPGIVGLGKAAALASAEMAGENARIEGLRNRLWDRLKADIAGIQMNGHPVKRLANNLNLSIPGVEGESLLVRLDLEGVAVSSGSACSSGSDEPSHVLLAIGLSRSLARGSVRITLGRFTTEGEIDRAAEILIQTVRDLRALSEGAEPGRK
jgi:cysteine desulfurase